MTTKQQFKVEMIMSFPVEYDLEEDDVKRELNDLIMSAWQGTIPSGAQEIIRLEVTPWD